jgi:hypothetical protein
MTAPAEGPATQRHGNGGLCEEDHWCPNCEDFKGSCVDLFMHPICGLVACASDDLPAAPTGDQS